MLIVCMQDGRGPVKLVYVSEFNAYPSRRKEETRYQGVFSFQFGASSFKL